MTTSKKVGAVLLSVFASIFVLMFGLLLSGCNNTVKTVTDDTKINSPTITGWRADGVGLDTSININFDEITIESIDKITFELYQDNELLGTAVSEGENLDNLMTEAQKYWANFEEEKGTRTLSCAFKTLTEENDDGEWVRSACTATEDSIPNKLVVKVLVGNIEYVA